MKIAMAIAAAGKLRDRVNPDWPDAPRATITKMLGALDVLADVSKPLDARKADFAIALRSAAAPVAKTVAGAVREMERASKKLEADRAAFVAKATKPADAAVAGEIRSYVRNLGNDALPLLRGDKADPDAQRAVLSAPLFLSGSLMTDELRKQVEADFLNRNHPDETAQLDATGEALHHTQLAADLVRGAMTEELRFEHIGQVDAWLEKTAGPSTPDPAEITEAERERMAEIDRRLANLAAA